MEKKKNMKFYWEEQDEKDNKQRDTGRIQAVETQPRRMPVMKFSFTFPKMQAASQDISIKKTEREIIAAIPIPGFEKDNIKVNVSSNSLRIRAEKKKTDSQGGEGSFFSMSSLSCMEKSFSLPDEVDPKNSKINFAKGIIIVTMPRAKKKKFRLF